MRDLKTGPDAKSGFDSTTSKAELRTRLRQRRQSIEPAAARRAAQSLTEFVTGLPGWSDASRIALYLAADGEIDTAPLAALARKQQKTLYLPVIDQGDSLTFAQWRNDDQLTSNRYDIPEPPSGAPRCPLSALDMVFLPLVAWDLRGGRLGMGGGFYDRTLSGVEGPLLVGLAHACQQVTEVPQDDWDVSLDFIATDNALQRRQ